LPSFPTRRSSDLVNVSSNFSAPFIRRPVATSLITLAILLSGVVAFRFLPVAPLPQVDFPTISVGVGLPGASPETMASAVATPLERQFGRIAGITQMTSSSGLGSTGITPQFDLNRDINAADPKQTWAVSDTDQLFKAYEYQPLIVAGHVGAPVRLRDVADVVDSVEDSRNLGLAGGKRAVLLAIFRQPGANMIETVDRITALLPLLSASISPSLHLSVAVDRTTTIRASVHDVEVALIISIIL